MSTGSSGNWMWADACEVLARAERMHRELFRLARTPGRAPAWEPPVDMFETAAELLILVALPGVDPERVEVVIDTGILVVAGQRTLPPELRTAVIHRLELPQGRFERRIRLPGGRYGNVRRSAGNGYVAIALQKA